MKTKGLKYGFIGLAISALVGCTDQQVGSALGAAGGAGIGSAITNGDPLGTALFAGAGAMVGDSVARSNRPTYYYGSAPVVIRRW